MINIPNINNELNEYLNKALDQFGADDLVLIDKAIQHTTLLHAAQELRPDGESYINHILRVPARIVNDFGIVDKDIFIAALYHDAVEDQLDGMCEGLESVSRNCAFDLLAANYGDRVRTAVFDVTNSEDLEAITDRSIKYPIYVENVIAECDKNLDSFWIKLSDFFDNGMRLESNIIEQSVVSGVKKYYPLFDYFISRMSDEALIVDSDRRAWIMTKLLQQQKYVAEIAEKLGISF